jgi:hypothetical protein
MALSGGRPIEGDDGLQPLRRGPSLKSVNWQDHVAALDHISRDAFAAAIGTNFKVFLATDDTLPVWMTLFAVEDLPKVAPANGASFAVANRASSIAPTSSGFVLVFGGSSALPQGTRLFEHENMGRFALFIVPEGRGQQLYSAVVNRLDGNQIIAVPFGNGQAAQQAAGAGAIKISVPTSSAGEIPSHGPSGSQGAQRGALGD